MEDLRRMCGDEVGTVAVNVLRGIVLLWAATWVTTQISLPLLIAPWCGLSGVIVALLIGEGGEHISVPISFALLPAAIVAVVYGPRQFALARRRRLISNSTCVRAGLAWLVLVALFCFDSVGSRPVFGLAWGVFIATMAVAPVAGLPLWCDDVRPGWSPTLRLRWSGYTEEVWGEDGQEKGVYSEHM